MITVYTKIFNLNIRNKFYTKVDPLYNSSKMAVKTANKVIKTPIIGLVPHPGFTFPYSEFKGIKRVLNTVFFISKVVPGIEPGPIILQIIALPLGYTTTVDH